MNWLKEMFHKNPGLTAGAGVALLLWSVVLTFVAFGPWALAVWIPAIIGMFIGFAAWDIHRKD